MPRPPTPGRFLARTLEDSAAPIFALSNKREIVFANCALAQWLGIELEQLIGRRCDYASGANDPLTAACCALCPPPEAFTGQVTDGAVSRLASEHATFERRSASFLHVPGSDRDRDLLLVVLQPTAPHEPPAQPAISPERLHALLLRLRSDLGERFHLSQLLGESDVIRRVREQVQLAAQASARVLIVGPPGSGREHVARTIHYAQSAGSIGPLVPIACSLVDAEQMQAALTSLLRRQHESPTDRPPAALLLDVDRLRPEAQQELAGFLNLPQIELHTLATSRVSLQRLAAKNKFRRDLSYKLSTLTITLTPLSRRREDIPLLAQHFLEQENAAGGRQLAGFQPAALELLAGLSWTGNGDELARAVREACQRATGPQVLIADLPDWVHLAAGVVGHPRGNNEPIQLDQFLAEIEKELLSRAMRKARGNKSRAAQVLGLSRQRLLRRLAQLGLIAPTEAEEPIIFEPVPEE